jgi:hypothetical protein
MAFISFLYAPQGKKYDARKIDPWDDKSRFRNNVPYPVPGQSCPLPRFFRGIDAISHGGRMSVGINIPQNKEGG